MPLNLSDGEFLPYLQYDAKSGRWFAKAEGANQRSELERPTLVFDMPHIKTGWIRFPEDGSPPEHVWDGSATDPAQRASRPMGEGWKRGFEVLTFSTAEIPGTNAKLGMRSFSSNAFAVNGVISGMYCEYEAAADAHPGALPIFVCRGVKAEQNKYSTVYEPVFELAGWVSNTKVPEIGAYHSSRVQVLPPLPAPPTAGNGRPPHQYVTDHKEGYDTMRTVNAPAPGQTTTAPAQRVIPQGTYDPNTDPRAQRVVPRKYVDNPPTARPGNPVPELPAEGDEIPF